MTMDQSSERRLKSRLLLDRRVEGDRLVLSDDTLRAALDGSTPLSDGEKAALLASPLTLRRFRVLADAARHRAAMGWQHSAALLRAADSGSAREALHTEDGYWSLHVAGQTGAWRLILVLNAAAPFAAQLLQEGPALRVLDGAGTCLLRGHLDSDGELEGDWPFILPPLEHLRRHGGSVRVERAEA
jgi:hypothetical protein